MLTFNNLTAAVLNCVGETGVAVRVRVAGGRRTGPQRASRVAQRSTQHLQANVLGNEACGRAHTPLAPQPLRILVPSFVQQLVLQFLPLIEETIGW